MLNCSISILENFFITKKSADLVRDDQGNVNGTIPSYSLENVEKFVNIVFSPNSYIRNFVFLFENIAEIQFPINYLTSRIKNGNFVVKRWDDKRGLGTGDWSRVSMPKNG